MNTPSASLYDASNINQYTWPDTEDGRKGKSYLYPLIKAGVKPYLQNVSTQFFLVTYKDVFLPLTVNDKEYDNSYIASNYYAIKFYEEYLSKKNPLSLKLQKPLLFFGGGLLKLAKINKTLFLNNWLMTNSLASKISTEELGTIVAFLTKRFPSHTIIFRHVDKLLKEELLASLGENQFHLLKTRDIFFYTPGEKHLLCKGKRATYRKDLKIIEKHNFKLLQSHEIQEHHYPRILALYEMLYVDKYTKYSPRYTIEFIKNVHQSKAVEFIALEREGVIEGFLSHFILNKSMVSCLFGYDVTVPHALDIYKLLSRLTLEESEKQNLVFNDGSGGDYSKLMRGEKQSPEYMGVYSKHLSLPRRLLWDSVAFFYKKLTK